MFSVLLVCTGNLCRSPLAEAFLDDRADRLLSGGLRAVSAGTGARIGIPPTEETVRAGVERGVSVGGTSAPLTRDLIDDADLVLTMTRDQRDEVLELVPEAAPRTFTLKELVSLLHALPPSPGPDPEAVRERIAEAHGIREDRFEPMADADVVDPIGLGIEVYRSVAWEIEGAIDELMDLLFGVTEPATTGSEG